MELHELLEGTLKEHDELSKRPDIKIYMGNWHIKRNGRCMMCLGGVYLHTHGFEDADLSAFDRDAWEKDLSPNQLKAIDCLDYLRQGAVRSAWWLWYGEDSTIKDHHVTPHSEDQVKWRSDMDQILQKLKEHTCEAA